MIVNVNDLSPPALDWAVTKIEAERKRFLIYPQCISPYSSDWSNGGMIIEREKIQVSPHNTKWNAIRIHTEQKMIVSMYGPTPLIAAMRCYVASKFGDEIDVPEELI